MARLCRFLLLMMGLVACAGCGSPPKPPVSFEQPGIDLAASSGVAPGATEVQRLLATPGTPIPPAPAEPVPQPIPPAPAEPVPQPIPPAPAEPVPQPIPPAPAEPGSVPAQVGPATDAETVIGHDVAGAADAETVVQGPADRPGQAGAVASSMPAGMETAIMEDTVTLGPQNAVVPWIVYRHPAFGFTLRLPGHWTEWLPPDPPDFANLPALAHIGFHDRDMVAAGTAELEPLRLLISVYANSAQLQPLAWLQVNGLLTRDEATETLTMAGLPAVRVCSRHLIAPACAVYIAHKGLIYRFAVVAEAESSILAGLSFAP